MIIDNLKDLVDKAIEASKSRDLSDLEKARMINQAIRDCNDRIKTEQKWREDISISNVKNEIWVVSAVVVFPIGLILGHFWFG